MEEEQIDDIYLTMLGQLCHGPYVGKIENLYRDGGPGDVLYGEVYDTKNRLVRKLGGLDEDEDVEYIINTMMKIAQIEAYEMFRCGWRLAKENKE